MDKNLTIRILGRGPTYQVTAETDTSSATGEVELPPEFASVANLAEAMGALRSIVMTSGAPAPHADPRALGVQLFQRLFTGRILELYTQALASADTGVRIRLNITASGDSAALASLPWEILTSSADASVTPLAFGKRTVLVRAIDVTDETRPKPFEPPLRILFIVANPTGTAPLNLSAERDKIVQAFGGEPRGVSFSTCERPTREGIADALARERFHVVHFMGHGDFDPTTGKGALLLEHDDRSPHRVDGDVLRVMLEREGLQLVFLNACKTATTGSTVIDPFGGVAAALLAGGIPAVIAMQFPISDKAAITFAQTFYRRLAQGMAVDMAAAEARAMLYDGTSVEWATPVLYLRPRHGVLLELATPAPAPASAQAPTTGATPVAAAQATPGPANAPLAAPQAAPVASGGPCRVFIAATTLPPRVRSQMVKELAAKGIEVLPSVPNADIAEEFEAAGHDARIRDLARSADLFVHILGADPGEALAAGAPQPGAVPDTFPVRQLTLGAQLLKRQLVLLDDTIVVSEVPDAAYRELIGQYEHSQRDRNELEFLRERQTRMVAAIGECCERIMAARRAVAEAARQAANVTELVAYVDVHKEDYDQAQSLIDYLETRGVRTVVRPFAAGGDPKLAEERFRRDVRASPTVILFYGKVGYEWITSRFELMSKIKMSEKLRTKIGLYVGTPEKPEDDLSFADMLPTARNMGGFDPAAVDALLEGRRT